MIQPGSKPPSSADKRKFIFACLVLCALAFAMYTNTLGSPFVFDDTVSIEENPFIESLWPFSRSLDAPPGAGSSGRPLVSFSLALNYALGGRQVLGYHLFNIAVLALSAMALFGLARRNLLHSSQASASGGLAFAMALLWLAHPLHTDTLNHVVYRNGAMMGLFYFLALYGAVRVFDGEQALRWKLLCVLAAAAAMACKEVAVSLPLAVLALDRQIGAGTVASALVKRKGMYAGLAATWGLLALCVMSGDRGDSVGFGHTDVIGGVDYLRTQARAITQYLKLSVLAGPFTFDYGNPQVVRQWGDVMFEAGLLGTALIVSIVGTLRRSGLGLLGLAFFAALAPTSSVIPLAGELVAEHRMYLPLAPLVAFVVFLVRSRAGGFFKRAPWLAPVLVLSLAAVLTVSTVRRNGDYASRVDLWQDTVEKVPQSDRAWNHLALALKNEGRSAEAEAAFLRTLEIKPDHGKASFNYGNLLFARGDLQGASKRFGDAARANPGNENIRFNHGNLLVHLGQLKEGLEEYRAALEANPNFDRPLMLLAWSLATTTDDSLRDGTQALLLAKRLNALSGHRAARHLDVLAAAMAETGEYGEAARISLKALELARSAGQTRLAQKIEARRLLYLAGKPARE